MGWPPFGPDDRRAAPTWRAGRCERAGGDPTVLAHCGLHLLQAAREYDWGMAVLQSAATTNPNNQMVVLRPASRTCIAATSTRRWRYFHRGDPAQPRTTPKRMSSLTGIAHAQMVLGDYDEALGWATRSLAVNTDLRPAPSGCWSRPTPTSAAWTRRAAPGRTPAAGARGDGGEHPRAGQCAKDPGRIDADPHRAAAGRAAGGIAFAPRAIERRGPLFATLWKFSPAAEGHEAARCAILGRTQRGVPAMLTTLSILSRDQGPEVAGAEAPRTR